MTLQAFILLAGALIVLWFSNHSLTLVILPTLPIALAVFMVFGAIAQTALHADTAALVCAHTVLQENLAGFKVVKAFARERRNRRALIVPRTRCWCSNSRSPGLLRSSCRSSS